MKKGKFVDHKLEYTLKKDKMPSVDDLILAQTYMYDHLIVNPDHVRKCYSYYTNNSRDPRVHSLTDTINETSEYSPVFGELCSILRTDAIFEWDAGERENVNDFGCCFRQLIYYVSVKIEDGEFMVLMASCTLSGCNDWGGGEAHRNPMPVETDLTYRDVYEKYPSAISYIDIEEAASIIMKNRETS